MQGNLLKNREQDDRLIFKCKTKANRKQWIQDLVIHVNESNFQYSSPLTMLKS